MSAFSSAARVLLFTLAGAVAGFGAGLLLGLAHVELADVSGFEGYSGFVVVYWGIAGLFLGMFGGAVWGLRKRSGTG